jgi:hypothetical protein
MLPTHGYLCKSFGWNPPQKVVECAHQARPGYSSVEANEYQDEREVLITKVGILAELIRNSETCMAYTGAGISTSSGIGDYG